MKTIRVFVSSPGDVQAERMIADRLIRLTAEELGIPISVQYSNLLRDEQLLQSPSDSDEPESGEVILCPYFWEYQRFSLELPYQDQIPNTAQFDLVICILWSRLGTKLHPRFRMPDGSEPRSGTDYEIAWARRNARRRPAFQPSTCTATSASPHHRWTHPKSSKNSFDSGRRSRRFLSLS